VDPGPEVDETWWDDMLVAWFEEPLEETAEESKIDEASAPHGADNNPANA
jgi:hypothetical protein